MARKKKFHGMFGVFSGPTTGANGGSSPGLTLDGVVALGLTDQPYSGTITLPTHFSIPCVSGSILSQSLYIRETLPNGTISQVPAQFEAAAYWPDGSVKWTHAHCNVQWVGGVAATYHLIWGFGISTPVGSTLTATSVSSGINVDTGSTTFCIMNTTPGIKQGGASPKVSNSQFVLYNGALPYSVSGVGLVVESSGTQQLVVKATGWLTNANTLLPAKFETRIKARAGSSIVDFDHATIFTDNMKNYPQLNSHAFYLTCSTKPQILTKDFAKKTPFQVEDIDATTRAVALIPSISSNIAGAPNPLTGYVANDYTFNEGYKLAYLSKGSGQYLNPGLPAEYRVLLTGARVSGDTSELTLNTIQNADMIGVAMHAKFAINLGTSGSALQNIYELYPIGYVAPTTAADTYVLGKVAPFSSKYTGSDYNYGWLDTVDSGCRNSLLGKFNNHNRYNEYGWHIFGNTHEDEYPGSTGTLGDIIARPSYHRVWSNNHNGEAGALWQLYFASAETGLLKQARIATDYVASVNTCHHTPTGSYQDAGSLRYPGVMYHCKSFIPWGYRKVGDGQDDQDMGFDGHFVWPETMLWSWLMDADRWSKSTYEVWLSGITYTSQLGSLHYSWPVGHFARETNTSLNQAMIAYEHYPSTSGLVRDIHGMAHSIVDAAQVCSGDGAGNNSFATCGGLPYATGQAGALWPPTFLSRYYDLFPASGYWTTFMDISARNMKTQQFTEGVVNAALNATQYLRSKPNANTAGSGTFIEQFEGLMDRWPRRLYNGSSGVFQYYGNTYEPDKDGHFAYQWPRFKYALKQYIKDFMGTPASPATGPFVWDASTNQLEEVGQYWSASTNGTSTDTKTRGIKIYVLGDTNPLPVDIQAVSFNGGNIPGTNFWFQNNVYTGDMQAGGIYRYILTAAGGAPLGTGIQGFANNVYGGWSGPTLPMSLPSVQDFVTAADPNNASGACCGRLYSSYEYKYNITYTRPTSWLVQREQYIVSSTGLTELLFGSNGIEIFRPITTFPEVQALQSNYGTEIDGYILKNVSGCIWPIVNQPLTMTFRGGILGTENTMKNPIYINVNGSGQWLLTGQTCVFTIPGQQYTPIHVFGDLDAHCKVTFDFNNNSISCYPPTYGYRALFGTSGNIATMWPLISGATF